MSAVLFDEAEIDDLSVLCEESAIRDGDETPTPDMGRLKRMIERRRTKVPFWPQRQGRPIDYAKWGQIQEEAVAKVFALRESGVRAVCGCGPTGFGKTRTAKLILQRLAGEGSTSAFYTHRQMLLRQTHIEFVKDGIEHGVRWRGMPEELDIRKPCQLVMIPSERAAVDREKRTLHPAQFTIFDEHHANSAGFAKEAWQWHWSNGAFQLGLTATPVNQGFQEELVYFGRPSQMRAVGALVPAQMRCPEEIDLRHVGKIANGELSPKQMAKRVMIQRVVGQIYEHWQEYNPELRPTLGFGPSVEACLWLVDEGWQRGIACCSIDGEKVYFGEKRSSGERVVYRGEEARRVAMDLSRDGSVSIVWNRLVFSLGIDWPWLEHIIFATKINSLAFWIQAAGRGLRAYAPSGKSQCLIQDHCGHFRDQPSPNEDLEWELGDTVKTAKERQHSARVKCPACHRSQLKALWEANGKKCQYCNGDASQAEETGAVKKCPFCDRPMKQELWEKNGKKCVYPDCGKEFVHSEWKVIQTNGRLKKFTDADFSNAKPGMAEAQQKWNGLYWPSVNSKSDSSSTFRQLKGMFHKRYGDRFLILEGKYKHEGSMILWDKKTRETRRADMMPAPGSVFWDSVAKGVSRDQLQRAER